MVKSKVEKELSLIFAALLISMMIFAGLQPEMAYAASTEEVSYTITYGQAAARSMLESLNQWRTGSEAWYWNSDNATKTALTDAGELIYDYGLERIAMKRAAELAISFSHTRPDGSDCFSAYDIEWTACGENIAVGYEDAERVLAGWQEENEPYEGQGHRRNMLSTRFGYIGIGHVVCNGVHYWTQEFNGIASGEPDLGENNTTVVYTASMQGSSNLASLEISGKPYGKVYIGDTVDLSQSYVGVQNDFTVTPIDKEITWTSLNPDVADVTEEGIVTAKSAGTADIQATATLFGNELSEIFCKVKFREKSESIVTVQQLHNGRPVYDENIVDRRTTLRQADHSGCVTGTV